MIIRYDFMNVYNTFLLTCWHDAVLMITFSLVYLAYYLKQYLQILHESASKIRLSMNLFYFIYESQHLTHFHPSHSDYFLKLWFLSNVTPCSWRDHSGYKPQTWSNGSCLHHLSRHTWESHQCKSELFQHLHYELHLIETTCYRCWTLALGFGSW